MTSYPADLTKTRSDIASLKAVVARNPRDPEKRVRLAFRQYHLASLTADERDYTLVEDSILALIQDFGPKEDVCLLKATLDGRFHRIDAVKEAFSLCPALADRVEGRSILADVDFQQGRYEKARVNLEQLISEQPTWENLARLAHWHGKMGDPAKADQLYFHAEDELTAKEMRAFAWLEQERGSLALSRGQILKAREHYERAAVSFPDHWRNHERFAALAAAEENFDVAETLLRSLVARVPKPEAKQALGELLLHLGRTVEAQPWFEAAEAAYLASARNGQVHYYHHLTDFYADAGGTPAEAVRWARLDVALRPNFSTQSALAWALYRNNEWQEGLEWARLALGSGAQDAGIYGTAAALFEAAGNIDESKRHAAIADEINPRGAGLHLHL